MRTIPGRNPLQEAGCHPAEVISCDKKRLQEAGGELGTLPGDEWVHSYRGVPAPLSEANSSPDWDNACLTYWTSHLALNSRTNKTLVSVHATLLFHFAIKRFTWMKQQLKMIQVSNKIYVTLLTKVKALFLACYYWRIQIIVFKHWHLWALKYQMKKNKGKNFSLLQVFFNSFCCSLLWTFREKIMENKTPNFFKQFCTDQSRAQ